MQPETRSNLHDILAAGRLIRQAVDGVSLGDYLASWEKQSAVERQFLIIGEALVRIRDGEPSVFARVPNGPAIVRFRNILVHSYDTADPEAVYGITGDPLLELLREVESLMPHG